MKKILKTIGITLGLTLASIPIVAYAVQVTVPSAPTSGYTVVSATTGNYLTKVLPSCSTASNALTFDPVANTFGCNTITGGGGSGGGTWASTTSSVPGRLINYSLNNTDIITIGGSSTSTAKFIFDPNTQIGYFSGNVGIGTKSPNFTLETNGEASSSKLSGAGLTTCNTNTFLTWASSLFGCAADIQFSTTSAAYWLTQNLGNAFSTTSANAYINASSTIAHPAGLGSSLSNNGGVIQWNGSNWVAVATSSLGITGSSGSSSVGPLNTLQASNGSGGFIATGTPQLTVGYLVATSTDATSTFAGPISVTTQSNANISFSTGAFLNSVLKLWGGTEGNVSLGADGQESINVQPDGFATAHGKLHELDGGICASDPAVGGCIAFGSGANVGFGGDSIALGDNTTATYDHSFVINPTGDSDFAPNTLSLGASGGVFIQGQGGLTASTSGNIGIGTTSPYAKLSVVGQVVGQYFTATSSTASAFPYASTTALSAQTICLTGDTCRTTWPTGGGSAFPFTNQSYGVSTSTTVAFLNGLFSTASSTFSGSFHLPNIANGMLTDYGGLVSSAATTTFTSPLIYAPNNVTCQVATGSVPGCLSAADWTTFNGKSSFAYPFGVSTNSTSTLTGFNGGLTAYASSTIGSGTATGLTVNGNLVTTGALAVNSTATSTVAGTTTIQNALYVSTTTPVNLTQAPSFGVSSNNSVQIGTTTTTGILNIGNDSASATTTIMMGKIQFDGYSNTGGRVCAEIIGTAWVILSGACNP